MLQNKNRKMDKGSGKGKNKGGAFGPGGYCICAKCGERLPHQRGVKCTTIKCPVCGKPMIREELLESKRKG
jgi:ribosomal protein S26